MNNISSLALMKKLLPYFVFFVVGIYAGISLVRFKPLLFQLNEIPKEEIEIITLSEKVGKLISLPTDEKPILETVSDLEILKDKPFFAKAEVEDKVLVYEKSAMAILYRPSKNIIINTLSPNYSEAIFSSSPSPVPTPTPTLTPTIEPTPTPTIEPTPTVEATPTASPSATPTQTPTVTPKSGKP